MKSLKEVIGLFPDKPFSEVFKSRISDLRKRAATPEQKAVIDEMAQTYNNDICHLFNSTIEYLKNTISDHLDSEIEDIEAEEIERILTEYKQNISKIENVDIGTPDFETARNHFNNEVNAIWRTFRKNEEKSISLKRFAVAIVQSIKLKPLIEGKNTEKLEKALETANKLNKKLSVIESAHQAAESLLAQRETLITNDVETRIDDLEEKSKLHKGKEVWAWFIAGSLLGLAALLMLLGIIHGVTISGTEVFKSASDVSIGGALLRLSLVSIILYFAFYCIKQFSIHRHLYQSYCFKQIALKVMINLRGESDELEKKLILAKGLEAIFNEPSTGLVQQPTDHSGEYWQSVQRILEKIVTKNTDSN